MKAIYQTVSRRSKKKNQPRTFDGNAITVRTLHKSEKALLIILSEIDGDDSETKEPDISEEEIDEVEELQGSGNLPPAVIRMLSKNPASQMLGWPKVSNHPGSVNIICWTTTASRMSVKIMDAKLIFRKGTSPLRCS